MLYRLGGEDGASLFSGSSGGINIEAEEAIMDFSFSQAGGDAASLLAVWHLGERYRSA